MVYGLLLVELFLEKEDKGDCFPGPEQIAVAVMGPDAVNVAKRDKNVRSPIQN